MKNMFLISFMGLFSLLFYPFIGFSQNRIHEIQQNKSIYDTVLSIKKAYSNRDYASFISLFPDNMKQFTEIYGYDEEGKKPLYDDAFAHINYLFNKVTNWYIDTLCTKVIEIAINGRWDADAVNYFQDESREFIKKYPREFLEKLSKRTNTEAASVWYFLFDGPHPSSKGNEQDMKDISKLFGENNKQTILLKQQYEKLITEENH